jgi:hypothetical protein
MERCPLANTAPFLTSSDTHLIAFIIASFLYGFDLVFHFLAVEPRRKVMSAHSRLTWMHKSQRTFQLE